MADVSLAVDVAVPARVAYDQWSRFEEFPEFMPTVLSFEHPDETHLSWTLLDSTGREQRMHAEITEQVPGERISWRSTDGGFAGIVTFRPTGARSCRVTLQHSTLPEGDRGQFGDEPGLEKELTRVNLESFKKHMESTWPPPE
ncbi:SRPBCC family protein [Nocardiopsis sediminis]|uniref:SRPBCC family protein n=1 Tax=Nocardiopsis sediminis TaxID=1778267 RepID=A0ABV8FK78_9ACTN